MISSRLYVFIGSLLIFVLLESIFSERKRSLLRRDRWWGNYSLGLISSLVINLFFPLGLVSLAVWCEKNNIGLLNHFSAKGQWIDFLSLIILDFFIYLQHFLSHKWSFLWRFHRVHHSDPDVDTSNAIRFHPVEITLSMLHKMGLVLLMGFSYKSIFIFEILLSSMALFNHSDIYIPRRVEKLMRFVLVTPQMHIIHHSSNSEEMNSNFCFNISLWDRLLGTYRNNSLPNGRIGLSEFRSPKDQKFLSLTLQPFVKQHDS